MPFFLAVAINATALVVFAASPYAGEYPLAALPIATFLLMQILLPACRPAWESPLCPGNVAQAFFWVQLVLIPLLIGFDGVRQGTLPRLPAVESINTGIVLRVLGYLAFCVTYQLVGPDRRRDRPKPGEPQVAGLLVVAFLVLGVLGECVEYRSPAQFLEVLSAPARNRERAAEETTLARAAGTFLRPFLGFGLVMAWSLWLDRRPRRLAVAVGVTAALVPLLLLANFSYNRGSLLGPLVALATAFSVHVRRLSYPVILFGGTLALAGVLAFGWYRATSLEVTDVAAADLGEAWASDHVAEFFQVYASGPQMAGYLVEGLGDGPLFYGRTLLCSVLHPVPVLGKAYREDSGVAVFNRLIYQDPDIVDQVIPYDAELYMNFHAVGVLVGFMLLGGVVRWIQNRFLGAGQAVESYAWLLLGLWAVFPGSLPVLSQMCIYFFWPIYVYFAVRALAGLRRPGPGRVLHFAAEGGAT
jgi:hypothetical protein